VLSPQHSGAGTCPSNDEIDAFITWAIGHYTVDAKRIYLTGLSCGAIGSWSYIDKYKDKVVAATLLISGDPGNIYADDGCALVSDLALWSVHGSADPTVNPIDDETTMPKFIACPEPRDDVKFNLIDGGLHDVWDKTYDLSYGLGDVYQWMLDHPKP
jgi:predicted peptidase